MFRFYRNRGVYWSNTRFAAWIRATFGTIAKPEAETWEGWNVWRDNYKAKHKVVYWVTEKLLNKIQNFVMFPYDLWDMFRVYVRNRFIDKSHIVKTDLEPGVYHDFDSKILHGVFTELVDFIECEKAWMLVVFDKDAPERKDFPFWSLNRWLRFGSFRNPEAGIKYLEWEISLSDGSDEDKANGMYTQSFAAKEQLELYNWWKHTHPNDLYNLDNNKTLTFEQQRLEEERIHKQEEEMLIRLIKIRGSLWT